MKLIPLFLRAISALLLAAVILYWIAAGAHRGWSMHQVPVQQTDEVTGINYVTYEDRYVPGIEVVAGGAVMSAFIFGLSFLFRPKQPSNLKPNA